eukprot:Pgem_evm1s5925
MAKRWVQELKMMLKDVCLTLVGNKIDLEKARGVSREDAEEYAKSVGAEHIETSAKLNHGVDQLFLQLTKLCVKMVYSR